MSTGWGLTVSSSTYGQITGQPGDTVYFVWHHVVPPLWTIPYQACEVHVPRAKGCPLGPVSTISASSSLSLLHRFLPAFLARKAAAWGEAPFICNVVFLKNSCHRTERLQAFHCLCRDTSKYIHRVVWFRYGCFFAGCHLYGFLHFMEIHSY